MTMTVEDLPPELILRIFSFLGSLYIPDYRAEHRSHKRISQVCHRWRALIHSDGSLWSQIIIGNPNISKCKRPWETMLEELLALSRSAPLDITIAVGGGHEAMLEQLYSMLSTSAYDRLETLSIGYNNPSLALQFLQSRLPMLRELSISLNHEGTFALPVKLSSNVPSLTHVRINDDKALESIIWPWTQLTHLYLDSLDEVPPPVVCLEKLVNLRVLEDMNEALHNEGILLDYFEMDDHIFRVFAVESGCRIQRLRLKLGHTFDSQVDASTALGSAPFDVLPELVLYILVDGDVEGCTRWLNVLAQDTALLPQLHTLDVTLAFELSHFLRSDLQMDAQLENIEALLLCVVQARVAAG
ncbi:hypothetical protein CYLTODRAFT_447035 [Cylindrobasidium torrendii FP15055 ss-10]|uniref:F-box domain-containing protein n=1 Tax=Cylindrobasidium torrendii FP15055 ss-10 TaxID=1314674 RepID=A0A0D7AXW9_9AGAR|nr:hypothetical protein CYLTODRAFT_447035 [Cylindrobasidium torrendii FP15055 ss-10]